jgi:hypothetical protein
MKDHFVHGRALRRIGIDHISHERFHELKPIVFLDRYHVSHNVRVQWKEHGESSDLHIFISDQDPEMVYIGGKWVTRRHPILVLWG